MIGFIKTRGHVLAAKKDLMSLKLQGQIYIFYALHIHNLTYHISKKSDW